MVDKLCSLIMMHSVGKFTFLIIHLHYLVLGKIVNSENGLLNGTIWLARGGAEFNAFLGIPYGIAPVGNLRFQPPRESLPWNNTLDATKPKPGCIYVKNNEIQGSEDCLYLNVYTPKDAKKGDKIPVIFYIYGGQFQTGDNMKNGPHYYLAHNVIMIQPNYRNGIIELLRGISGLQITKIFVFNVNQDQNCTSLGPLCYRVSKTSSKEKSVKNFSVCVSGNEQRFLSTGDSVISGNFGLKDQVLALHWAKENIEYFGGDSNQITLMGSSSGAGCVHLHTLSPVSKGLFQRAILQSFVGTSSLSFHEPDVARSLAIAAANHLGCDTDSSFNIWTCLMNVKAEQLALTVDTLYIWDQDPAGIPRPVVESKDVIEPFLTENPRNMEFHSPEQSWMIGFTAAESAYKVAKFLANDEKLAKEVNLNYKYILPIVLQYYWNTNRKDLNHVSESLRRHYFGNKPMDSKSWREFVQFLSHNMFSFGIMDVMKIYPGKKYAYLYNYKSNYSTQNTLEYCPIDLGVSHGADVHMLFLKKESFKLFTEHDISFGNEMIIRHLNFVTSGDPNVPDAINETIMSTWEPVVHDDIEYLRMDVNGSMESGLLVEEYKFWRSLPIGNKYHS